MPRYTWREFFRALWDLFVGGPTHANSIPIQGLTAFERVGDTGGGKTSTINTVLITIGEHEVVETQNERNRVEQC